MKLCIIGSDKRTETDLELLEKAKNIFDSVLYVPQSSIILKNNEVSYRKISLNKFDAILPRISKNKSTFAYALLKNINGYSPVPPEAYFISSDRFLFLDYLSRSHIPVPNIYMVNSSASSNSVINEVRFPVCLRIPSKESAIMFVNNKKEIRAVLDTLGTFNQPIYIEEFSGFSYFQLYVIGSSVFGLKKKVKDKNEIYFGKGKAQKSKIPNDVKNIALLVTSILNIDFCRIDISDKKVINVNLAPPLSGLEKIVGADMPSRLLEFTKNAVSRRHVSILEKMIQHSQRFKTI